MLPATWSALRAAETAADAPNATADNLANGAQLILSTFSRELSGSYGTHYLPLATSWTQRALEADPSSASAWEAAGDVAWITAPRMLSFLHCWPATATEGYRRAVDLGSASAVPKLADLELRHVQIEDAGRALDYCAPPQGLTIRQAAPDASPAAASPFTQFAGMWDSHTGALQVHADGSATWVARSSAAFGFAGGSLTLQFRTASPTVATGQVVTSDMSDYYPVGQEATLTLNEFFDDSAMPWC
jgi:hypothetical protein